MPTEFDPDAVLSKPLMVVLATSSPDGPRAAPMWYLWEDGALWMPSGTGASSVARIAEDPRVAAEIVDQDVEVGRLLHLGLRGRAEVTAMDVPRFKRLLAKYLGPDEASWNPWFIEQIACFDDPSGRMIRLVPDSVFTNNVSFFKTGPDLAWP
ncbi:MAG: pyridoxamine 5'-phosphate oxidase family protein [Pseudomonadota bacterium]